MAQEGPFRGYKDCNPQQDIVFQKTHKCSSSTIQNILLRYSLKHELNVVMPNGGNYLGSIHPFQSKLLTGTPWQKAGLHYNLFCLHNRWNGPEVEKLMGRMKNQRPAYFTILRDPVDLYISLWDYDQMGKVFGGISLEDYAMSDKTGKLADRTVRKSFGRNQMMWDFGLDPEYWDNTTAVKAKIEEVDTTFDLVLMTEHFSESIVLLKDLLCWDYGDITSLKLNAHNEATKSTLTSAARKRMQDWMWADYQLYEHFKIKFQLELDNFGRDEMKHELEILAHATSEVQNRCVIAQVSNEELPPAQRLHGHGVLGYKINTDLPECLYMGMKEVNFLAKMRKVQKKRAEEVSGQKFTDNDDVFQTLGRHVSLEKLKKTFKYKGPEDAGK
jgi:hypothetical protein